MSQSQRMKFCRKPYPVTLTIKLALSSSRRKQPRTPCHTSGDPSSTTAGLSTSWGSSHGDEKQLTPKVVGSGNFYHGRSWAASKAASLLDSLARVITHANSELQLEIELKVSFFTRASPRYPYLLIVATPNKFMLGSRTAPPCAKSLTESLPTREGVVEKLQATFTAAGTQNPAYIDENALRNHSFIVSGTVSQNKKTSSRVNMDQIMFAIDTIVPAMNAIFVEDTAEECKIIVGYTQSVQSIVAELIKLRTADKSITRTKQSTVQTIDSSQVTEASWVCFIPTCDKGSKLGDLFFMQDDNRVKVGLTRVKHIQSNLHGPMNGALFEHTSIDDAGDKPMSPPLWRAIKQVKSDDAIFLVKDGKRIPNSMLTVHLRKAGGDARARTMVRRRTRARVRARRSGKSQSMRRAGGLRMTARREGGLVETVRIVDGDSGDGGDGGDGATATEWRS